MCIVTWRHRARLWILISTSQFYQCCEDVTCSWTTEIVLFVPDAITDYIVRILRQRWQIVILSIRCVAVSQWFELLKSDIRTKIHRQLQSTTLQWRDITESHWHCQYGAAVSQMISAVMSRDYWFYDIIYKWQWQIQLVINGEIVEEVVKEWN